MVRWPPRLLLVLLPPIVVLLVLVLSLLTAELLAIGVLFSKRLNGYKQQQNTETIQIK